MVPQDLIVSDLRALLLVDVVDSTQLSQRLGDTAAAELWAAHDRIARDLLPIWRGREIDRTDGFLLLFDSAVDAIGYAFEYLRELGTLSMPVQSRVGLHVGTVILRRNPAADVALGAKPIEVEGLTKLIAARTMSTAHGGQILLTRAAVDALPADDPRFRSHGYWQLKGIAEPVELFEADVPGATAPPPADTEKSWRVARQGDFWLPVRTVRHSLPAERDAFVGRRDALDELARRYDDGARLISILGMGGAGKTRLATRFGWARLGAFAGGVWFCDLAAARTLEGLLSAVAQGLGVPPGQDDPDMRIAAAIVGRGPCLVILDNFEQVTRHGRATVGRWLDAAPEARFLVTTRELLRLPGEAASTLAPLGANEAADLFLRRVSAADSEFAPDATDRKAITQLLQLLEGLPLAIELAAARARIMSPAMLLERMRERFRLLAGGSGRADRHATLRATLDWSWDLLTEPERMALAQLSVFEGSFSLEAAEQVILLSGTGDTPWTVDILQALVDKSLVRRIADTRFDLLLSIREYAAERLAREWVAEPLQIDAPAPASHAEYEWNTRSRHCRYFASIERFQAIAQQCADLDNLVAACRWAINQQRADLAPGALEGAWAALSYRGPFSIGTELAEQVAAMAGLETAARARVALVAGNARASAGREAEALAHFQTALALARQADERRTEGRALAQIATDCLWEGQLEEAAAGYQAAAALARTSDDPELECTALNGLALAAEQRGDIEHALAHYRAALELARECGDRHWEASVLGNLGNVQAILGLFEEAQHCYETSLGIAIELGDRERESNALCNLGMMHHTQGRPDAARERSEAALGVAREMGHRRLECVVLCNLGLIDEAAGAPENAEKRLLAALAIANELGDRRSAGQILTYLALLHARSDRLDTARNELATGESLLREVSDRPSLALLHSARAETEALAGDLGEAESALGRAQALAGDINAEERSELGAALVRVRALIAQARSA